MTPLSRDALQRRTFLGLAGIAAIGSLAGCLGGFSLDRESSESVDRTFPAADVGELRVRNVVGDVLVTAAAVDAVEVSVVKRSRRGQAGLDAIDVRTDLAAGHLLVETAVEDRQRGNLETPQATITVRVPEGIAGPLVTAIAADIGTIDLRDTRGNTVVHTNLGDIDVSGVDGYLTLESELGSITAADVTGLDAVFTELGDVKVDLLSLRGDVDVGTQLGSVTVGVADDLDLDVLAESEGEVSSDLTLVDAESARKRVAGRLNSGGPTLRVHSELGDVALRAIRRAA